jgi:hypothetical protein
MSQGAKSGEYGGWGMPAIFCFVSNCWVRTEVWDGALSWWSCETVHAQFFRQNPLACPITNSHLLSNVVNGRTSILTEELLHSCSSFRSCAASGSPCVLPVLNRACHWNTTQDLVPEGLLNHCEGLRSTFPKIGTKFNAHSLFLSLIQRENRHRSRTRLQTNACENCPRPPSYVKHGTLTH